MLPLRDFKALMGDLMAIDRLVKNRKGAQPG
jgi:hypothetical protein